MPVLALEVVLEGAELGFGALNVGRAFRNQNELLKLFFELFEIGVHHCNVFRDSADLRLHG